MRRASLLTWATALAGLSAGCAFIDVEVSPPEVPAASSPTGRGPGRAREVLVVAPFVDGRAPAERARCGMQKNGFNMDTADVLCMANPGDWLARALRAELQRAGYRLLPEGALPGDDTVVIRGVVRRLFMEPKDHFFTRDVEADMSVRLVVTSESGLHAVRTFYAKGIDTSIASTQGVFQTAAEQATFGLSARMAAALTRLLDRYPTLGVPSAAPSLAWSDEAGERGAP